MPAVCLYFQVHQPFRLRRYSFFEKGRSLDYFDDRLNQEVLCRVARRCYIPANRALLRAIRALPGAFKVTFSLTGTAIEQMRAWAPEALESFRELAKTGSVEFLAETSHHSLASLYNVGEFREQIALHRELMRKEFNAEPKVFRNTELLYSDEIAQVVEGLGYEALMAEGVDDVLGGRSPNQVYQSPGGATRILLRNYALSDDIAFRFHSGGDGGKSLTATEYAERLRARTRHDEVVCLCMDYETFGEHHVESTGILKFLEDLPGALLLDSAYRFAFPSEIACECRDAPRLSFPRVTSWADTARDVSAWCGNSLQQGALKKIYGSVPGSAQEIATWRALQASDHFYYMSTKGSCDGEVHSYFSPFDGPYEAFIAYMNVASDFGERL